MKAVILAGGKSTRLSAITQNRPKCLLGIGETTIIDNQLDALQKSGIRDVVMITGFGADLLEDHVRRRHPDLSLTFVRDNALKGPAYGLFLARDHMREPFMYLNADLLCSPEIIHEMSRRKHSSTAVQKVDWNEEAVNVVLNDQGHVIDIGKEIEPDRSHGEFIGATYFDQDFAQHLVATLESLDYDTKTFLAVDAIRAAIQSGGGPLHGHDVTAHPAIEIDTAEDYAQAEALWRSYTDHV